MKYLIVILFLAGCSDSMTIERSAMKECSTSKERKTLSEFILGCAKAANPMSDEEGEDLVIQCERTGVRIICPTKDVCRTITSRGFFQATTFGDWGSCEGEL